MFKTIWSNCTLFLPPENIRKLGVEKGDIGNNWVKIHEIREYHELGPLETLQTTGIKNVWRNKALIKRCSVRSVVLTK